MAAFKGDTVVVGFSNQASTTRTRRSWAVAVALGGLYGIIGFGAFIQCGPQKGQFVSNSYLSGSSDEDLVPPQSLNSQVEILPGELSEPNFSGSDGIKRIVESGSIASETVSLDKPAAQSSAMDPAFCNGLSYGECLTLVIQIPSAHLQSSPGLSALNLVQAAPTWRGLFERACNEGLKLGLPNSARSGLGRGRVLGQVLRSRCVIQSLTDESTPLPALAKNELGLSVRLVSFEIVTAEVGTAPAIGKLAFEKARIDLKFHDAQIFGKGRWHHVAGAIDLWNMFNYSGVFGTARAGIRFNESLTFSFNGPGTLAYLDSFMAPVLDSARRGEGLGELGAEIIVVKQAVAAIAAGSNPVVPALILVAVAVDAIRDLCEHKSSDCRIRGTNANVRDAFLEQMGRSEVVSSETRATLIDGIKNLPFALLQGVFKQANLIEMERRLELPTKPFWVGH
jgi:hypothetical protein